MQPKIDVEQEPVLELDQGICRTCIHASRCRLRSDPSRPIYHCEEFSAGPSAENPGRLRIVREPDDQTNAGDEQEGLRGLCINCENRSTCTLPRPAGGVWHCEEYR